MILYDGYIDTRELNNPRTKIVGLIAPKSRVLEIGCATGYMAKYLADELGCDVLGVEFDPEAAEIARSRGVRVVQGDVESPEVRAEIAGEYDYVIMSDVLEHLTDPERTLRHAVSFLAKDGHVLASIPNVAHWSIRWRLLLGRFDYTEGGVLDRGHLRFFTRKSIVEMFERCGLSSTFDGVYLFPRVAVLPAELKRSLGRSLPCTFTYQFVVKARQVS